MAVIETWYNQDLQKPVKVNYLDGNLFSHNGNGNRIGVHVFDNGEPATLSGTVTGYVVTADGSTVPCTGTRSGNAASILIPAAAYQPGAVFITIFLTDGDDTTTLASVATTVLRARTGSQVDPGSVVSDWTDTINTSMQAVVDANAANMATPYASLTFPVPLGKYTLKDNLLYRCISPIASSEEWTAAHWTRVPLADDVSDLKSALNKTGEIGYIPANLGSIVRGVVHTETPMTVESSDTRLTMANPVDLGTSIFIEPNGQKFVCYVYDSSNNYSSARSISSWSNTDTLVAVPAGYKIRLQFSKSDNSEIQVYERQVFVTRVSPLAQSFNTFAYFSAGKKPAFAEVMNGASSTLECTFPSADIRIYHRGTAICNTNVYSNTKFTLSNLKKLVWDMGDGTISVIDATSDATNIVDLLCLSGEAVSGLLKPYYDISIKENQKQKSLLSAYFSNSLSPFFKWSSSGIQVEFPIAEFRVYDKGSSPVYSSSAYSNQTFTVGNLQQLVLNPGSATITVENTTSGDIEKIVLLGNSGGSLYGLLNPYYEAQEFNEELEPYFSSHTAPSFNVGNGTFYVAFPEGQSFRLYSKTGKTICNTSSFAGTEYAVPLLNRLVYNLVTGEINIVPFGTASPCTVELLSFDGKYVSGLFTKWYKKDAELERYDILSAYANSNAAFIFFSDVHAGEENVKRIIHFAGKYSNYVNAIINGGDTVSNNSTEGLSWYNSLINETAKDVLTCVGNHDTWINQSTWERAEKSDVYDLVIAPMLTKGMSIVQPSGASTSKALYYYKDYNNIRVIVLDAMYNSSPEVGWWDNDELEWLENTLDNAKTNSNHVICVAHPPYDKQTAVRDNSLSLNSWSDYRTNGIVDNLCIPEGALNAVKNFIENGGHFVCWLTGHTHVDNVLTAAVGQTTQFNISIATAKYSLHYDGTNVFESNKTDEKWYDCFDYVAVDTTNQIIKVYRIGYDMDASMRVRNRFAYSYANNQFMSMS